MCYFNSGVLLKLYLREPNSPQAVALVGEGGAGPPLTALHRLEMKAAIGQKQGRGEITATEGDEKGDREIGTLAGDDAALPLPLGEGDSSPQPRQ